MSENAIGQRLQRDFADFCDKTADAFSRFDFLKGAAGELREVRKSAIHPFNIAVFGRMKTGKSTLINALVGRSLAITGVEEATATINVLAYSEHPGSFVAHWKDSPPEVFQLESLQSDWNGKTADVLERVKRVSYLELFSDAPSLKECEITDTPGTGSEESVHEDVTQSFLAATDQQGRRADAIVYVFPPVGRESDVENLETYRKNNCLPDSTPYNSVAVLHKWDHIFWENGGDMEDIRAKARRQKEIFSSMVADIIPVSGPLALAAVEAPDVFWRGVLNLCRGVVWMELERALSRDEKWDRDEMRRGVRKAYPLPWPSFQVLVREISKNINACPDIAQARGRILALSGINALKSFLDANFFKRGELIRQKQMYGEICRIKANAYALIEKRKRALSDDSTAWDALFNDTRYEADPRMSRWIARKRSDCRSETEALEVTYDEIDRSFVDSEIKERIADADCLVWFEALSKEDDGFSEGDVQLLKKAFASLVDDTVLSDEDQVAVFDLRERVSRKCNSISSEVRENATRICERLGCVV